MIQIINSTGGHYLLYIHNEDDVSMVAKYFPKANYFPPPPILLTHHHLKTSGPNCLCVALATLLIRDTVGTGAIIERFV